MSESKEIWKDIPNYEGLYQVSNIGRVKGLSRYIDNKYGGKSKLTEKIMSLSKNPYGYLFLNLTKNKNKTSIKVHQLVAMAFLGHKRCGFKKVINHINFDRADNRVENLEIVSMRENTNHRKEKGTSKFPGVWWSKNEKLWMASIYYDGNRTFLGRFENEEDAGAAYQKELSIILKK